MMMTRRFFDAKFGCVDACAALPTTDGTNRRACAWHRRSHRVGLITIFLHLTFLSLRSLYSFEVRVFDLGYVCSRCWKADTVQCFTILWQQPGIQALQVRNTREEWVDAPPIPGTLVIKCVMYSLCSVIVLKMGLVA